MKNYYWLTLMMTLSMSKFAMAQCTGGTNAGSLTPTTTYQTVNVPAGNFYYTFVVPACIPTYDFSYCSADGSNATFDTQITILDNTGAAVPGGYDDDFCSSQSHVTWTPTASGTYRVHVNLYNCLATTVAAKLAYKLTNPGNMAYSSSTVVQSSTATTTKCDVDQDVICLQVVTTGVCSPLTLTSINLGAGSSTSIILADVSRIHVYYTGTSNVFNNINEFVPGGTTPVTGSNTLSGSQVLASGTNYFWVAYDINTGATTSNVVDASLTQFTLAATNRTPTATNPAGTRTINVCPAYPSTKALGLQHWVKSDAGVTGSPVSAWGDQSSGTSITGTMAQATSGNRPSVVSNGVNFQTYLRFDGVDDVLLSTNTFAGNTMYSTTSNTIFMVKNVKGSGVNYKWQTASTGASRMGLESNSSIERFDFADDASGRNSLSTTNIINKDIIVCGISDATNNTLKLNGNIDAVKSHGGVTFAPAPATVKSLTLGANDPAVDPNFSNVDIAEVMTFNVKLGSSELRRVESYLALKYGITLGNNRGTGSGITYISSDGTSIWSNKNGYHNHVIGIGRDNAAGNSGLNKLRSKSVVSLNSNADVLTIANGTGMGGTAFGTDKSFLIVGNNAKPLPAGTASLADLPLTIQSRLSRVWLAQETGTVGTVSLKFDLSSVVGVGGVAGANDLTNVRLLVDGNGVFASGATIISPTSFNNTVDTVIFQVDFTALTGYYFTVGSVNKLTTPLPVTLTSFTAVCNENEIIVNWETHSEHNNHDFKLEKSYDLTSWETVGERNGAGSCNQIVDYQLIDPERYTGVAYYRLIQTDFDGKTEIFGPISVTCAPDENSMSIFPNPAENNFYVSLLLDKQTENLKIEVIDMNGKVALSNALISIEGSNLYQFSTEKLNAGAYFVKVSSKTFNMSPKKLVILK